MVGRTIDWPDCQCRSCSNLRHTAELIQQIKRELPSPEYDWEDLERRDRIARPHVYKDRS